MASENLAMSIWTMKDILDAIICSWTGALLIRSTEGSKFAFALGDEKFGFVICPHTPRIESLIRDNQDDYPALR